MKLHHAEFLVYCLIVSLLLPCQSIDGPVITEQNTTGLSYSRLLVQILTEPENLIRLWEGWDLALQMLKVWAKNSVALATLPFNKEYLHNSKDFVHFAREMGQFKSGEMKKFYYAQVPTRNPKEAPRFIKMTEKVAQHKRNGLLHPGSKFLGVQSNELTGQYANPYGKYLPALGIDEILETDMPVNDLKRRKRSPRTPKKLVMPFAYIHSLLRHPGFAKFEKLLDILNEALDFLDLEEEQNKD